MQAAATDRTPWPLGLVPVLVIGLAASLWWQSSDDGAVPAPNSAVVLARPSVVAPVSPAKVAPPPAQSVDSAVSAPFKLVGTVVATDGVHSFALVRRIADSQLVRLRAGDRVEGLTVSAIGSDRVVLAGAARAIVIEAGKAAAVYASPVPFRAIRPPLPEPEAAWAGDPAPFGH